MTTSVDEDVIVDVPAATAYRHCTRVEEFARFLPDVERAWRHDEAGFGLRTRVGDQVRDWEARIVERQRGSRIVWRCATGTPHAGVVTFTRLPASRCRVRLRVECEPPGRRGRSGSALGVPQRRIAQDLRRFADWVERRAAIHGDGSEGSGDGGENRPRVC